MMKNIKRSLRTATWCVALFCAFLFSHDVHAIAVGDIVISNVSSIGAVGTVTVTEDVPDSVMFSWGDASGAYNKGYCYANNVGGNDYACDIAPLGADTTYYVMASVNWSGGDTVYSNEANFMTDASVITTGAVTDITSEDASGIVVVDAESFNSVGVEWGTTSGNYNEGFCVSDSYSGGTGSYSCQIYGLVTGATYYVRAFGRLENGEWGDAISYGEEVTFEAQDGGGGEGYNLYAFVDSVDNITDTSATVTVQLMLNSGECTGGGEDPSECFWEYTREIEWRTSEGLYEEGGSCAASDGGLGTYTCDVTGLTPETTHYLRPRIGIPDGEGGYNIHYGIEWFVVTGSSGGGSGAGDSTTFGNTNDITTDVQDVLSMTCNQTGNANDYIVEFGNLTPGTPVTGSTTCAVTTNSDAGYDLAVKRTDADATMDKDTDAATNITDRTTWDAAGSGNASVWGVSDVNLGFTVYGSTATKNTTWWGTGTTQTDANNLYAGFPTAYQNIMQHTSYSETATMTEIGYKLDVPTTQKSGTYAGEITYQVTTAP